MTKKWLWPTIGAVALVILAPAAAETVYSDGWIPPRLVDGVWVTSGVSDEVAKQYALEHNEGKTRAEVRQIDWELYWQWHWDEADAPEWAMRRGEEEKRQWERHYANQSAWGVPYWPVVGQPVTNDGTWVRMQRRLDLTDPKSGDWWRRQGWIMEGGFHPWTEYMLEGMNDSIFEMHLLTEQMERLNERWMRHW